MPKEVKEIKNFNVGTVLNVSEKDIPSDAAAYSLNVNPVSESGILSSIKSDKYIFASDMSDIKLATPVSWNNVGEAARTFDNPPSILFNNINALADKDTTRVSFVGTKGFKESLIIDNIQPFYEKLLNYSTFSEYYLTSILDSEGDSLTYINYNHTITKTAGLADSDITVDGFNDDRIATITLLDATRTNYDTGTGTDEYFTITTPDSRTINYHFSDNHNTSQTGTEATINGVAGVVIGMSNVTETVGDIAQNVLTAINHANGHSTRITISRADGVLTLTNNQFNLEELLSEGDYISLANITVSNGDYSNHEIIKVEGFDTNSNKMFIKRACFGTQKSDYAIATYYIYSNKQTIDGVQKSTDKFTASIGSYSDISANHFGGNSSYLDYSNSESTQLATGKVILSNYQASFSAEDNSLTIGGSYLANTFRSIYPGDIVTFYHSEASQANTGFTAKVTEKSESSVNKLTFDTAPTTLTNYQTGNLFFESNLLKNHTLNHSVSSSTVTVGADLKYKINDWSHECRTEIAPTSNLNLSYNMYGWCANDTQGSVLRVTSGGYWESSPDNIALEKITTKTKDASAGGWTESNPDTFQIPGNTIFPILTNYLSIVVTSNTGTAGNGTFTLDDSEIASVSESGLITFGSGTGLFVTECEMAISYKESTSDLAKEFYPFSEDDAYVKIISEFSGTVVGGTKFNGTLTNNENDNVITIKDGSGNKQTVNDKFSKHDILKLNSEYMEITSLDSYNITVRRGALSSTIAAHDGTSSAVDVLKCYSHGISQSVDKSLLKKNQNYNLSFYAQDNNSSGNGAVSITFNGGYINEEGVWVKNSTDFTNGYITNVNEITQEARWIDFSKLDKPNNDSSDTVSGLDNVWRKYSISFAPEIGKEFLSDLKITVASRGIQNSYIYVDLFSLVEDTVMTLSNENSLLKTTAVLNNKDDKLLVSYDSIQNKLRTYSNVFDYNVPVNEESWIKSKKASANISSSQRNATLVSNNREMHIGFGGKKSDTPPQWLGYINHTVFGKEYEDELYQDEDTVHMYDAEGSGTLSKVCLAGEYENVTVASFGSNTLVVTFNPDDILNVGDNIIIREWMDTDNSWGGNGVWVVTAVSAGSNFSCKRLQALDEDPSGVPLNSRISFRPYFYYGIKDGEPSLYRIWPDARIKSDVSGVDTTYPKGKIEKSLPLSVGLTSICTYYNKGSGGSDPANNTGGRIYGLSATSNELIVINVMLKYNEWDEKKLVQVSDIDLVFKSFKWSNDNINGDVGGNKAVFDSVSGESTPTIKYAGVLSDILETKGPNKTYARTTATADNTTITPSMFDTRLWIQSASDSGGFTEGDRFLFCGKTESGNTDGPDTLYCADRTPPTTVVSKTAARYSTSGHKFNAGPGANPADTPDGKRSYFYHYYDDDDNKHKLSRLSVVSDSNGTTNGASGILGYASDQPYTQYGYNVGYESSEGLPTILVAKHGLFQISDNDGDGVLDGTGVVVPSTTSITDTSEDIPTGPYGRLHEKVCGHAVGLIGGVSESKWYRHWGRLHARMNKSGTDYFISNFGDGPTEDAPEFMNLNKCIFVSTDTHYGDRQPKESYAWTAKTAAVTTQTDLTISHSTYDLTTLEVGETVWLKNSSTSDNDICATITLINPSSNAVRVNVVSTNFDSTGTLYPATIEAKLDGSKGGVVNSEIAHHWSFDSDNKLNSDIFTEGPGSGHYTKTFMTPASYWGGPIVSTWDNAISPGYVWKHEKLSLRGGIMMRPFQMDDDDFFSLIIGSGLHIDMPSWPNNIYHKTQTNIHYNENNSTGYHGSFASKLFITAPIPGDTESKSKVYMCDLNFMFPDLSSQLPIEAYVGTGDGNYWNGGDSAEICFAGKVDAYFTSNNAATNIRRDATNHPVVEVGGGDFMGINQDIFIEDSNYRTKTNSLYGLCISIKDAVTGTIETRQIIGSEKSGTSSTSDMMIAVHYPFGNAPAADDEFWVWKHSLAATAPIRLAKKTTLRQGLQDAIIADPTTLSSPYSDGGEISVANSTALCTTTGHHNLTTGDKIRLKDMSIPTYNDGVHSVTVTNPDTFTSSTITDPGATMTGNWELIEDSDSSASNPLTVTLDTPLISAHFGGLDMRKTKGGAISAVADSSDDIRLTGSNHRLAVGDIITYKSDSIAAQDGTYEVKTGDTALSTATADKFDIENTTHTNDAGDWTTNQFEMLIAGTASKSQMGELRAGFTQWDKGNIEANIQRYDSVLDSDRFSNFGESSITITPSSLGNQSGDVFLKNNRYYYKVSYIYDGYQEGPLSDSFWSHYDAQSRNKLVIKIKVKNTSRRLTHVCIYRKNHLNDFYKLVKQIDTDSGWSYDGTQHSYILGDEGSLGATYESRTGMSEVLDTIKLNYGISTEIDGYLFAGDCSHSKIKNASTMVFRSKPGMFSIFDYANDFLTLKSKPTAMANFNGRLYVFDNNNTYRINPQNLVIEDTYEGVGCSGKDSVVVTEYGMFFADKTGAYMHNGQTPVKISEAIQKGGDTEEKFSGTDNIKDVSWESTVTNMNSIPYVTYNSSINSVLFNVEYLDKIQLLDSSGDLLERVGSKQRQYIWSFHLTNKRWDLWELSDDAEIGKPFVGRRGEVYWPIDNSIYEHLGGADNRLLTWVSKKITLNQDSIVKVFNKIKFNGIKENVQLDGDKLIVKTSTGDISSSDITYSSKSESDSEYKLSGSNKKGRWIQFKVENLSKAIDSFGLIFRRKSAK